MRRQLAGFVVTGSAAALAHMGVVWLLVEQAGLAPLRANIPAFGVAFLLSYAGHRHLSFAATAVPHRRALPRFIGVAVAGLTLNQLLFALLLACTRLPYGLALFLVLATVAGVTFLLARHWAFAGASRRR